MPRLTRAVRYRPPSLGMDYTQRPDELKGSLRRIRALDFADPPRRRGHLI